jgi:predicted  nucleic acid-binding Zn-ribbon protein
LEQQRDQCARRRQDLQDRIAGLAEERDRLAGRDGELGQKLEQLQAALRQAEERAAAFAGLVAREEQYQACCTRLTTVLDQVAALKTRKLML